MRWNHLTLGLLLPVLALGGPAHGGGTAATESPSAAPRDANCTFAIRAKNNLSFDVWVELYDSTVRLESAFIPVLLRGDRQLKIQNHRIARGKTMDRRYTASGSCSTRRLWTFHVRIGGRDRVALVSLTSDGTGSRDRILDLGESSKWGL